MASISPTARSREAAACPAFPSTQLRAELQSVATQRRALAWPFLGPSPERTKKKVQERHRLNTGRKPSPIPTKEEHSPHHPVGGKKILDLPSPHPPPLPSLLFSPNRPPAQCSPAAPLHVHSSPTSQSSHRALHPETQLRRRRG